MSTQTENDRITQLLLNMTTDQLIEARAQLLHTYNTRKLISLRRIVKSKIVLVDAQLEDRT